MSGILDGCCSRCLPQFNDIGLGALTDREVMDDLSYPYSAETRGDVIVPRDPNRAERDSLEPSVR